MQASSRRGHAFLALVPVALLLVAASGCEKIEDPSLEPAFDPAAAEPPPAKPAVGFSMKL